MYKLLEYLCPDYLWEGIAGDLEEQYSQDLTHYSRRRAKWRYFWNALLFIRPEILLRNKFKINNTTMIANYMKTAGRNMAKQKLFTFINAFGLSIGISFGILIYLFVLDENSFDTFHANAQDIFRVEEYAWRTYQQDEDEPYMHSAYLQTMLGPTLKEELSEVKYATRFNSGWEQVVKYENNMFIENIAFTDNDFFKMFSFEVQAGEAETFLLEPKQVVITESIAEKYFGDEVALNKSLSIDIRGSEDYLVVGVIADPPKNSSLDFSLLISQTNRPYYDRNMENWRSFNTPTFVQLQPGSTSDQLKESLIGIRDKYMKESLAKSKERYNIPDDVIQFEYRVTNMLDIHLNNNVSWHKASDPQYSLILSALAILIIVIASINYVSLALTTSAARRMEVGVRKAIGASKKQLIQQFSLESIILAIISMVIGIILMMIFLPTFNEFTNKSIELNTALMIEIGLTGLLLALMIGAMAGGYPAFFLSAFKPASVLKGGNSAKVKSGLAKPLVLLQFILSSALIISAFVMYKQMYYITSKDLGFDKERVLVIPTQYGWTEESNATVERMRNALSSNQNVLGVAGVSNSFNHGWSRYGYEIDGENKAAYVWAVDPSYVDVMGIRLKEGRNFDASYSTDSTSLIINEALAADMGWEKPLEEHLNWREDSIGPGYKIIGVAENYHFRSLHSDVEPMLLSINKNEVGYLTTILVRLKPGNVSDGIAEVEATFKEVVPDRPFDYTFLDEDINRQYSSFERWMKIMSLSTLFAILISGLGLFGLAGINAVNRTKEIGIRKVFGAPISAIFVLLNRQFIIMTIIAFAIAAPLGAYLMNEWWLSDFKFKIELGWEIFAMSFGIGLIIAMVTVSYHGLKAATTNPASTLKYE